MCFSRFLIDDGIRHAHQLADLGCQVSHADVLTAGDVQDSSRCEGHVEGAQGGGSRILDEGQVTHLTAVSEQRERLMIES